MIDFVLNIFSTVLQMDMRNHHDIPFALPMIVAGFVGGMIGFTILKFIGNEQAEPEKNDANKKEIEIT